jgi:prepilin-type processing-associated H-X9-DG protein
VFSNKMMPSYVAIAGSVTNSQLVGNTIPGVTESRNYPGNGNDGIASTGGVLTIHSQVRVTDITDGTTNTMIVGEQSDLMIDASTGQVAANGWRAAGDYGWTMGYGGSSGGKPLPPHERSFNCTTIRYPINYQKSGFPNGVNSANMQTTGIGTDSGANSILMSAHTGGINAVFGDGSVHFLSQSTDTGILSQLATRDDGMVTPPY